MRPLNLLLLATCLSPIVAIPTFAQCIELAPNGPFSPKSVKVRDGVNKLNPNELKNLTTIKDRKALVEEQVQRDQPDFVKVMLNTNSSIKLALSQDADSGYINSEDYIQFVVNDDVWAYDNDGRYRCVAIAKGTRVYGIVDYAKGRTPFRIKGRARLEVYVDNIMLVNGKSVEISFSGPYGLYPNPEQVAIINKRKEHVIRECKYTKQNCIVGRLTRAAFAPGLVAAGAAGLVGFTNDDTTRAVAGLTLLSELGKASGVGDLVNGSNAAVKKEHVFEARTKEDKEFWVSFGAPKKEEKPADKP